MQQIIEVRSVFKTFGKKKAVDDVSFSVGEGEVFGLLGPNGAGKTSLIRMLIDIIKPDSGEILFYNQPITTRVKDKIGYLPEERGLYRKQKVHEVLTYFARLKGLDKARIKSNLDKYLAKMNIAEARTKKVEELSKGMQQKIQLIAAIIAEPEIIILDEPFSGLDPVNLRLVNDLILELKRAGKTVLLSTHQMTQVEVLCDRIFMINRGQRVLYGALSDVKKEYSDSALWIRSNADYAGIDMIERFAPNGHATKVYLKSDFKPLDLIALLAERRTEIAYFEQSYMPLEDIFVKIVKDGLHE